MSTEQQEFTVYAIVNNKDDSILTYNGTFFATEGLASSTLSQLLNSYSNTQRQRLEQSLKIKKLTLTQK